LLSPLPLLLPLLACPPTTGEDAGPGEQTCTAPSTVECVSELTEALDLTSGAPSPQEINNLPGGGGSVLSVVDARAGGLTADPRQSYLYARFTSSGLFKVPLNDEEALESTGWDIAFHRYIVRLNGGSSGPGCLSAARLEGADFDAVDAEPSDATFARDEQLTDSCAFRATTEASDPDNELDFGTSLRGYYNYIGCLEMTYDPHLIRLADGRLVKLMITHYYDDGAQADCQDTGDSSHAGAGVLRMRWAFLDEDINLTGGDGGPGADVPAFESTDNLDGTFLSTIDSTQDEWIYVDLESNALVTPDTPDDSNEWDLGFNRFHVKMNGGVSGTGGMEAIVVDGSTFADLLESPDTGWQTDTADDDNDGFDEHVISSGEAAWFIYNTDTHELEVTGSLFSLRSVEGAYWRLELLDYYRDLGGNAVSGYPTFRWGEIAPPGGWPDAGPLDAGGDSGIADGGDMDGGPADAGDVDSGSADAGPDAG
jgi:hypothetical protein